MSKKEQEKDGIETESPIELETESPIELEGSSIRIKEKLTIFKHPIYTSLIDIEEDEPPAER